MYVTPLSYKSGRISGSKCLKFRLNSILQRKREEFWDTQPAYGGAKGEYGHTNFKLEESCSGPLSFEDLAVLQPEIAGRQ